MQTPEEGQARRAHCHSGGADLSPENLQAQIPDPVLPRQDLNKLLSLEAFGSFPCKIEMILSTKPKDNQRR